MRTKTITFLLALMLCVGAFALPMTAYAAGGSDTTPPILSAVLEDETLNIKAEDDISGVEAVYIDGNRVNTLVDGSAAVALKDYAGTAKQVSVYAVDYSGNRSDTVKFDNPYYQEPAALPSATPSVNTQAQQQASSTPAAPTATGSTGDTGGSGEAAGDETGSAVPEGAFTPEGTGTVLDEVTETEDDKQFYTVTTEAGNVFYLVIDGKREDNNVYFLNTVTEDDLMALAEKEDGTESAVPTPETCTCPDKCEAGAVNTSCAVCKHDLTGCTGEEPEPLEPEQPQEEPEGSGTVGTIIFVVLALAVAGGAGYYFKIVRPKQQAALDDEFEDEGYGEDFDPDAEYGQAEYLPDDDGMDGYGDPGRDGE